MHIVAENGLAVAPVEDNLHTGEGAGIDNPFRAQQGADQRDNQIAGIGIDNGGLLHRLQAQRLSQQRDHQHQAQLDRQAGSKRQHQTGTDLRSAVNLEG